MGESIRRNKWNEVYSVRDSFTVEQSNTDAYVSEELRIDDSVTNIKTVYILITSLSSVHISYVIWCSKRVSILYSQVGSELEIYKNLANRTEPGS